MRNAFPSFSSKMFIDAIGGFGVCVATGVIGLGAIGIFSGSMVMVCIAPCGAPCGTACGAGCGVCTTCCASGIWGTGGIGMTGGGGTAGADFMAAILSDAISGDGAMGGDTLAFLRASTYGDATGASTTAKLEGPVFRSITEGADGTCASGVGANP